MSLSERLQTVIGLCPDSECVADIGTDHGFVPMALIEEGKASRAVASDVGAAPLQRALEHVERAGLSEKISLRLGDGLKTLSPGEADTVVITGMGGLLIRKILSESPEIVKKTKTLILSPQSDIAEARRFVSERGFLFEEERMVFEDGKFYVIMRLKNSFQSENPVKQTLSPEEMLYGPCLLRDRPAVFSAYLKRRRDTLAAIIASLSEGDSSDAEKAREEKLREIKSIDGILGSL